MSGGSVSGCPVTSAPGLSSGAAASGGTPPSQCDDWRVRMEARSKRKPSMWYSVAQCRSASTMKPRTTGWLQFSVFPHPL